MRTLHNELSAKMDVSFKTLQHVNVPNARVHQIG